MASYAVLGPGGVGGFLAGALARSGEDVTIVATESTAAAIAQRGVHVQSVVLGDFTARPRTTAELDRPVDVLFLTSKATSLQAALSRIHSDAATVVPLLNGRDHMELLRSRLGSGRVAAGVIRIESDRPAPGEVVQSSPQVRVDLAADNPDIAVRLPPIADTLEQAGIPARIGESEAQILWSKLVRLNALSATTTASGRAIGAIREDPEWRPILIACIEEGAAVASADGAVIDPAATLAELEAAHPTLGSSMQRDVQAGRTPELDAIQGSVMRTAARHGLQCPTVFALATRIAELAGIGAPPVS